ncbi:MAG: L,D-transpeptidase family protein [Gammaproteobacteria bacterium]|uniref:L,D-transpeptidase family protein n=1 Tax=Pseudomaricurvus alcaniphilus TaxID=1166482 RepID=UPI00140DFCCA|nr:L,D-transpeptidase family protein [Pseudomaricurvus alcaniphilus]MBR9912519.1 L,D-transpeptidase family protein [Gammaproteobacteria bacterium]NHN36300.1 L,D-transpeptidase family protein [Pseudomaricurvus alcaniphilus]
MLKLRAMQRRCSLLPRLLLTLHLLALSAVSHSNTVQGTVIQGAVVQAATPAKDQSTTGQTTVKGTAQNAAEGTAEASAEEAAKADPADFVPHYPLPTPGNDLVGANQTARLSAADTLIDVAARHHLGYNVLRSANPEVDAWLPGEGTEVLLPLQTLLPTVAREGIVINVAEMRLYHYPTLKSEGARSVYVYPISVGRREWSTPLTRTRVTGRAKDPSWYPPESIRKEHAARGDILPKVVPPGPNNPLGNYLLSLGIPSYFIHGTDKKFGIGMQVTHGCIRMYGRDIEQLTKAVPNNTPVTIINQTVKTGWHNGKLYLEIHPALETMSVIEEGKLNTAVKALVQATKDYPDTTINWDKVDQVVTAETGLPTLVGQRPQPTKTLVLDEG